MYIDLVNRSVERDLPVYNLHLSLNRNIYPKFIKFDEAPMSSGVPRKSPLYERSCPINCETITVNYGATVDKHAIRVNRPEKTIKTSTSLADVRTID